MMNKAEQRYQVKASVSGRAIVATHIWSKSITAQSLTIISEGLCRAQVTGKKKYFVRSTDQLLFFAVAKIVELNPNAIPGGRPQIIRLRVVQFEVDGSVCCSCDYFERVGIVCRHILTIVHNLDESMVDVGWRSSLSFYFGKKIYARVTSVVMQALESSLKKVKASIPLQDTCYPMYSDGAKESYVSPFFKRGVERRFLTKSKYLLHQSAWKAYDEQGLDIIYSSYADGEDSSDEQMVNNKFFGATYLGAGEFIQDFLPTLHHEGNSKQGRPSLYPFVFNVIMLINLMSICIL
jgi:hypothetical protein